MSQVTAHYGEWSSPITGDSFVARSVSLSQVRVDGPDTYWVEGHPLADGRNTLLRRNRLGHTSEVLPLIDGVRLPDVRTRVHEYGGRAYAVHEGLIVFSDGYDGRLYRFDRSDARARVIPLTPLEDVRYGDIELAVDRGLLYAVREDHRLEGEPSNSLVAIPLDGSAARDGSHIIPVYCDADFVMAPTLSPDNSKLAWLTWNHPDMPWTHSVLHVASLDFEGRITTSVILVDQPDVCVYEPRWTLNGDLIHVDDSTGWANLYRTEGFTWFEDEDVHAWTTRLRTRPLHPGPQAFSHPHWQLGLHTFDNFDNDLLICSWAEDVTWHIGTVRLDNGLLEEWSTGWWPIGNVASADGRVVFLADSATHAPAIIEVKDGKTQVLRPSSDAEVEAEYVSLAQAISWSTRDGERAHGFFYPPANPNFAAPEGELPPLVVNVHGGPTTSCRPGLKVPFQFWTSRGFAVLDVNYRGSTGFGRNYRERLNGNWGVMDVHDCVDGALYLAERGLIDRKRMAIRGGSAGGFTTLAALTTTDVFSAGCSFYGVGDLRALADETHKFESRYAFLLLGTDDMSSPIWEERSPLFHTDRMSAPLLLLQGEDDKVVPPSQATQMHEALNTAHHPSVLKIFAGEGHGFRRGENIKDAWETELGFYGRVWGLQPQGTADVEVPYLS
ncbi:alpha/beta hydrolase family protein [Schaalia sp. lx-260]|uniref:alpha/beta hydrolase family protein n=1 Tax=Schaalia sp. lx-260 TaxID=2899082 RepID=UPI001E2BB549|nr:prolyl oligopeptidase family serine peptidase [Schaalia sp. lx-260]MCD4549473.1 prolyl oligopeptidase family serine peptidase [Schaalia sp. lx-260]